MLEGLSLLLPRRVFQLRRTTRRIICGAAWAVAAVFLALSRPTPDPAEQAARLASGQLLGGRVVQDFHFADLERSDSLAGQSRGGVRIDPAEEGQYFWGNWNPHGPRKVRLTSTDFTLERSFLYIPIAGYPSAPGNRLRLEVTDPSGQPLATIYCRIRDPGEAFGIWGVDIRGWRGLHAHLVLEGQAATPHGWFGAGAPICADQSGRSPPPPRQLPPDWYRTGCLVALGLFVLLCFALDPAEPELENFFERTT